jgi:hypothetical protein
MSQPPIKDAVPIFSFTTSSSSLSSTMRNKNHKGSNYSQRERDARRAATTDAIVQQLAQQLAQREQQQQQREARHAARRVVPPPRSPSPPPPSPPSRSPSRAESSILLGSSPSPLRLASPLSQDDPGFAIFEDKENVDPSAVRPDIPGPPRRQPLTELPLPAPEDVNPSEATQQPPPFEFWSLPPPPPPAPANTRGLSRMR